MLVELNIKNFAIIEELKVNFTKGLNIITGETGAGKSILIEAIGIILGSRSSKEYIQSGYSKSILEGVFYIKDLSTIKSILEEYAIDIGDDNLLVITKEIHLNSPSLSRVNGRNVTLNMLKNITNKLVDIFGQHEHQSLLDVSNHQSLIDSFGDVEFLQLKENLKEVFSQWTMEKNKLKKYSMDNNERDREIDILNYQINEIDEARLTDEDNSDIDNEYRRLLNIEEISKGLQKSLSYITNDDYNSFGILELMNKILIEINNAKKFDHALKDIFDQFQNINFEIEDLYRDLRNYLDNIEIDNERLNYLTDRVNLVNKLKKKYGNTIEDIRLFRDEAKERLNQLINLENEYNKGQKKVEELEEKLKILSSKLTIKRQDLSFKLEKLIKNELDTLNMKNVKFKVNFDEVNSFTSEGKDKIEFLISTNPGEELKPLSKIVSGGEMSRIMLAFKNILAFSDNIPTLIFDEIDTGISGRTAQIVGEKIHGISRNHQVICISHLPQIAALADSHYSINKEVFNDRSLTTVSKLSEEDRIKEMARLLGGVDLTEITLRHAEEMIEMSKKMKRER